VKIRPKLIVPVLLIYFSKFKNQYTQLKIYK